MNPGTKHWREECGVIGVFGDPEAAHLVYLGLYAQQHRGQEGCGMVTTTIDQPKGSDRLSGQNGFCTHRAFGLVSDSVDTKVLGKLRGDAGIGHVRYSTQGGKTLQNVQPFHFRTGVGPFAIAHNGNLTNGRIIREDLEGTGSIFQSTSDTEVFIHLIARSKGDTVRDRVCEAMRAVRGAYSLVLLGHDRLYAVRDPYGFRPLVLGEKDGAHIVASETCALDLIDATFVREVEPGELVEIRRSGVNSYFPLEKRPSAFCAFEPIYFARPDSQLFGDVIYQLRKKMGVILAKEAPAEDADIVIAVPDSGVPMAMGYAESAGLPLELGLVRNHYIGRTFIEPAQEIRDFGVKLKLNPVVSALAGKSVVVVDDSIVRGTTSAKIMRMLRRAGVRKIHMRIGSPPITHSCYYGVDTPKRQRLLAAQKNVDEIRDLIGCDSIAYLSQDGLRQALGDEGDYCFACFSGSYPADICEEVEKQPTDKTGGPGLKSGSV